MKIKIGERKYQLPFKYDKQKDGVVSADGFNLCRANTNLEMGDYDAANDFIADALNEKAREWIPIEILPEENGNYLITRIYGNYGYTEPATFHKGTWYEFEKVDDEMRIYDKITAWRPLPDAFVPETEEEGL